MLTELDVENFKAFGRRQRLPLAPITLLYGGNSAGKSSLIQTLLLMRQTLTSSEREGSQGLMIRGELTDLGSFDALIHGHDRSRHLTIGWKADLPLTRSPRNLPSPSTSQDSPGPSGLTPATSLTFGRDQLSGEIRRLGSEVAGTKFTVADRDLVERMTTTVPLLVMSDMPPQVATTEGTIRLFSTASADELRSDLINLAAQKFHQIKQRLESTAARLVVQCAVGFPTATIGFDTNNGFIAADVAVQAGKGTHTVRGTSNELQIAAEAIHSWLRSVRRTNQESIERVQYIGPMRKAPERIHVLSGEPSRNTGTAGENVVELLARRPNLRQKVNNWFRRLEIPYSIEVKAISDSSIAGAIGEVHCLLLKDRSGVEVSWADVGYGIGQVLPVVVESCLIGRTTLCIEQPELHLHPALQARMAELFADRVTRVRGAQFILETHSEHLILRLQRLIRRGTLTPDQVCVLFVSASSRGSKVTELRIRDDGDFRDEWPGGFFDERYEELFGD